MMRTSSSAAVRRAPIAEPRPRLRWITDDVRDPEPLVAVCFVCRSVRDGAGAWAAARTVLDDGAVPPTTHGLCPSCLERLYPEAPPEPR